MGYPTTVDTGVVAPVALWDGYIDSAAGTASVANTAYLTSVTLYTPAVLTSIRARFPTGGSGHYDVGIYSDNAGTPNALLANAASTSTSLVTASGTLTASLLNGNLSLSPGRYWLALWIDNATDTIYRSGEQLNMVIVKSGTSAGPLPALASSLSGLTNAAFRPVLVGLIQGGWS